MKYKKIAIIHEVFVEFGGAERVLLQMLTLFPHADIYCPLLTSNRLAMLKAATTGNVYTSFLSHIPFLYGVAALIKPLVFSYWENLDLTQYDLVISLSHSFSSKSVITGANTLHVSYVFTPPRYLYAEYNETRVIKSQLLKFLLAPLMSWMRVQDYIGGQRPDVILADSQLVQKRIKKYYRRESILLYPAVESKKSRVYKNDHKKYFLCFSRLVKQKGTRLAIETCNKLKLPLLIVGRGKEEATLKTLAGPTISFTGFVPDHELENVFSRAFALINCAREEDFGLVNVESLAYGVPVIGYNSGGLKEIITPDSGVLFNQFSVESLSEAIDEFQKKVFSPIHCKKRAEFFSLQKFESKLFAVLDTHSMR